MAGPRTNTSAFPLRRSARLNSKGNGTSQMSGHETPNSVDETPQEFEQRIEASPRPGKHNPEETTKRHAEAAPMLAKPAKRPRTRPITSSEFTTLSRRPVPLGKPPVWSESRQALCETLPYYRSFQSTSYHHGNLVYGLMLGKDVVGRAYLDDEVAITRAGGKCTTNEDGQMVQTMPHSYSDADVKAASSNMSRGFAAIIIAGKDNEQCPTELPHEYNVLAHFQVTDVWSELNNGHHCIKYRLEKIDLATKSWWAPVDSPTRPVVRDFSKKAMQKACQACAKLSSQVFSQTWMCLNRECVVFFQDADGNVPSKLTYNADFLEQRTKWPEHRQPTWNIQPELPAMHHDDFSGVAFSRHNWKGIVCPKCGRCISRRHWETWNCETQNCGFVYQVPQPILSPYSVFKDHEVQFDGHAAPLDTVHDSITARAHELLGDWRITTYDLLPGNSITHFQANKNVNRARLGSDALFIALQGADEPMGLQRFPMKNKIGRGEVVASHFAINFGMPYNYVVDVESKSFASAPSAILAALARLDWAGRMSVGDADFERFNELLAVGYFEGSKMGFHDDGEKELGPTVATLSLGASAVMSIRMKERYHKGLTKTGTYDIEEPVLPGAFLEDERRAFNLQQAQHPSNHLAADVKEMYGGRRAGVPKVLLEMQLRHGDMVVMHGAEMQKYYEHKVEPTGKMRFALTSRFIKPELVKDADHWKAEYDSQRAMIYDGFRMSSSIQTSATSAVTVVNLMELQHAANRDSTFDPEFVPSSSPLSAPISIPSTIFQSTIINTSVSTQPADNNADRYTEIPAQTTPPSSL